jgi:hypothetical protein
MVFPYGWVRYAGLEGGGGVILASLHGHECAVGWCDFVSSVRCFDG